VIDGRIDAALQRLADLYREADHERLVASAQPSRHGPVNAIRHWLATHLKRADPNATVCLPVKECNQLAA
jgi:hypothetical protein